MQGMEPAEFYEDDEPVDEIVAAFEVGEKRVTVEPSRGRNEYLQVPWQVPGFRLLAPPPNEAWGEQLVTLP